ncbi:MAG: glycoside hydrolase family 3 C-terminal domain-containing protein, partial [Lachnospiraceae bacterium]|nr:glycoside hydrolase family 3 C-terminal domain-containing protein [Lachnospiraceae bacterium]
MQNIEQLIQAMTVEEKAALVSGTDFMYTNPIPRLGIPSLCMSDGPHGLRKQIGSGDNGVSQSEPATSFPTAAATASSWNPENLRKMGEAIAEECRHYGVHTLLGPGLNIKRNPLCGRNFEYFSEDPYLAGVLGAAMIEGVQSKGVGVSIKHFACNNSENYRFMGNSVLSENTMRRIYFKPFEYVVKHAHPATVMCAYNQINGTYCSENKWLLTDVLRNEWGFDGLVMTDWGAMHDRKASLKAGLDLEMPGDTAICRKWILDGIADGSLPMEDLDQACRNVLKWVDKYVKPADHAADFDAHHALAAEIAADSAVLMKNGGALPLDGAEKLHICGELFENMRYQGAGSSMIHPARLTTPKDEFEKRGIRNHAPEECEKILVFAGLTDDYESEGCDRENMLLPESHLKLIDEMIATGKPVVVVLFGGSPVELPFFERVNAVLNMYLPGQNGGKAAAELLFGEKNPSGKLAETWPLRYEDVPSHETFGKSINEVYAEGTEVGYRYYNKHEIPIRLPFGFGLSYTTFEKTAWKEAGNAYEQTITNTGSRFGGEVAELFIDGELRGFRKVYLNPGESVTVSIVPEPADGHVYDEALNVTAEPPHFPVTLESRFTDLQQSFMGRILYNAVTSVARKNRKNAEKLPEGPERDNSIKGAVFMKRILDSNSPRTLSMCAGKQMPYHCAEGCVELTNGHLFKGIRCFIRKIDVPKLPK